MRGKFVLENFRELHLESNQLHFYYQIAGFVLTNAFIFGERIIPQFFFHPISRGPWSSGYDVCLTAPYTSVRSQKFSGSNPDGPIIF